MVVLSFGTVLLHFMPQESLICQAVYSLMPNIRRKTPRRNFGDFQMTIFIDSPLKSFHTADSAEDQQKCHQKHQRTDRKNSNDKDRKTERECAKSYTMPGIAIHVPFLLSPLMFLLSQYIHRRHDRSHKKESESVSIRSLSFQFCHSLRSLSS